MPTRAFFRRITALAALALPLAACEKAPYVAGGRPVLVGETPTFSGAKSGTGSASNMHYFEVAPVSLAHPRELKTFFHWLCLRGYVAGQCHVYAWPAGAAPRRWLLASNRDKAALRYDLYKWNGEERLTMYPNSAMARDW